MGNCAAKPKVVEEADVIAAPVEPEAPKKTTETEKKDAEVIEAEGGEHAASGVPSLAAVVSAQENITTEKGEEAKDEAKEEKEAEGQQASAPSKA